MIHSTTLGRMARTVWHAQRVKRLVRDHVGQGLQCLVSVRETFCEDPACEGPATEVRIVTLDFRETRLLIHKPPSEVSASDVARAL